MRLKFFIALSVVTTIAFAWVAFTATDSAAKVDTTTLPVPEVPVTAVLPVIRDVPLSIEAMGTLHPSAFLEVRPQVSGTLAETLVAEGDWVTAGTPLFHIDSLLYRIKVQELEAQMAADQLALDAANKKMERFRSLAEKDLVSQSEWDEWETATGKARTSLSADDARLQTARLDLDSCVIKAAIAGRVGRLDTHGGSLIASGQTTPLTTISKMDPLVVEFEVTANEFSRIASHQQPIHLQTMGSDPIQASGAISFFDNHFNATSGLLFVRGKVPNPTLSLRPGQSVRVQIPVEIILNAMMIPQKAVRHGQDGPYVLVVQEDQTIAQRQIALGIQQGNEVIVRQGLNPAESVVTEGHLRLMPGTKVKLK